MCLCVTPARYCLLQGKLGQYPNIHYITKVTQHHDWFYLPAHTQSSVSPDPHINPSCKKKCFPKSIIHLILAQSIIFSPALQTRPCSQWWIWLLKAQISKLSFDLRDHVSYDAFRCWTLCIYCSYYSTIHLSSMWEMMWVSYPFQWLWKWKASEIKRDQESKTEKKSDKFLYDKCHKSFLKSCNIHINKQTAELLLCL